MNLTTTGPGATLAYEARDNTTTLADQLLEYDVTNRHVKTTLADGTVVSYVTYNHCPPGQFFSCR